MFLNLTDKRDATRDRAAYVYAQVSIAITMLDDINGADDKQTQALRGTYRHLCDAAQAIAHFVGLREMDKSKPLIDVL